jgi:signal transduction histidine kinase
VIFRRAKLRLALSYAVVQLILFAAFGTAVYVYVTNAFDFDSLGGNPANTAEASFATLRAGLLIAYAGLVVVVPVTSYVLASLAMRPIRASFEAQQRFVDDASHEFRTPLSAIQAQLELGLDRPRTAEEYRTAMTRSLGAAARLNQMLDDLLVLSRGARPARAELEPIDLSQVVRVVADEVAAGGTDRILASIEPGLVVSGSSSMLGRAVANLLTNALRYSSAGSPVRLTLSKRGNTARLAVEDHGVGMSRQERGRAFDRFWRADAARSDEGNGLGLSIVQEIARLHHGRVELESEVGVGTVVTLELPLSR